MRRAYDDYDFPVIFHALNAFMTVDLSAFYVDVTKDRLYTLAARSRSRRAAQTVMHIMADGLARLMAPVLPVTAEQLWKVLPGTREVSVHVAEFPDRAALEPLVDRARHRRLAEAAAPARPGQRRDRAAAQGKGDRQLARGPSDDRGRRARTTTASAAT